MRPTRLPRWTIRASALGAVGLAAAVTTGTILADDDDGGTPAPITLSSTTTTTSTPARTGVSDTVSGLEGGADDYVTKPFSFEELLARVRVRLRDTGEAEPTMLRAGEVVLDLRARRATVGHESIELTAREFTLAETLLRHPGQVLSREQLLRHVWGYDSDPGSNIVDVYVGSLRKELGDGIIETVRGMGYRLRS